MTARARRRLATAISTRTLDPPVSHHVGVVASVQAPTCTVTIDASTVAIPGVPYPVGFGPAAGWVVAIVFEGRSPRITARLS